MSTPRNDIESLPPPYHGDQETVVQTGAHSLSGILALANPQPVLNDPAGFSQRCRPISFYLGKLHGVGARHHE